MSHNNLFDKNARDPVTLWARVGVSVEVSREVYEQLQQGSEALMRDIIRGKTGKLFLDGETYFPDLEQNGALGEMSFSFDPEPLYPSRTAASGLSDPIKLLDDFFTGNDGMSLSVEADAMSLVKGPVKVSWVNLGEGWNGDYNPENPEDENLLRFDVSVLRDGEWEEKEDASYCTQFPAAASFRDKLLGLTLLMREFYDALHNDIDVSVKKLGESLSWISPEWMQKKKERSVEFAVESPQELTYEAVVHYLRVQGYPDPSKCQIEWYLEPCEQHEQRAECVLRNYDLCDTDRWFHLQDVLGMKMSFETALRIDSALWEEDLESLEINVPEDLIDTPAGVFRTWLADSLVPPDQREEKENELLFTNENDLQQLARIFDKYLPKEKPALRDIISSAEQRAERQSVVREATNEPER